MPKSSSVDLFSLIKALNKFEKGHLKIYASNRAKGELIYIKLFDVIDKQSHYNEQKILRKLTINHARLSNLKNYLYQMILNGLETFQANSITSKLKKLLSHAELLYEKSLYSQCIKVLSKAKTIAYTHEKYLQLLEIFSWEKELLKSQEHTKIKLPHGWN